MNPDRRTEAATFHSDRFCSPVTGDATTATLPRSIFQTDLEAGLHLDFSTAPTTETGSPLWYRTNNCHRTRTVYPVRDLPHAQLLLGRIDDDDPWITIMTGLPNVDHTYFQVFGSVDRMIAEGGLVRGGTQLCWRASAQPRNEAPTTVGPAWYTHQCWDSDVLTIHDAWHLLTPALTNRSQHFAGVPGLDAIWWEP
jgi:hypothetical protein